MTSGATLPTLPAMVGDCMFLAPYGDNVQAYAIADYAVKDLGLKKIAVWTDNSMDFTKTLAKFFKERATKDGATIPLEDFFMRRRQGLLRPDRPPEIRWRGRCIRVRSAPNEAGLSVKQIREAGLELPILSGDGFDTELVARRARQEACPRRLLHHPHFPRRNPPRSARIHQSLQGPIRCRT